MCGICGIVGHDDPDLLDVMTNVAAPGHGHRPPAQRRKHAFQIPLDQWLAGPLAGFVKEILLDARARRRGWFDTRRVEALLTCNGNGPAADGKSVWTLLCLELWVREFLDGGEL